MLSKRTSTFKGLIGAGIKQKMRTNGILDVLS